MKGVERPFNPPQYPSVEEVFVMHKGVATPRHSDSVPTCLDATHADIA